MANKKQKNSKKTLKKELDALIQQQQNIVVGELKTSRLDSSNISLDDLDKLTSIEFDELEDSLSNKHETKK